MSVVVKVTVGLLTACFLQAVLATTVEEASAQAMSSTNFWGVSLAEYRARVSESVPFLATNGTQSARQALCDWYVSLAGFSSPTNSVEVYDSWLDEQAVALSAYARFLVNPQFTNAWTASACRLGALRDAIPSKDELHQRIRDRLSVNGFIVDDGTIRGELLKEQDYVFARQRASDILVCPVVDVFGRRGMPLLPLGERYAFASNYVDSAHLSTRESTVIFTGLNP